MFRLILASFVFAVMAHAAEMRTNVEFAKKGDVSLTLDASVPDGKGPYPTVILVHGGGFLRGDKQIYVKPLFKPLTDANFTWFSINYRLADKVKFPAPVEDVVDAVEWVRAHAAEYKVDPKRIALVGESAGAYLMNYAVLSEPKRAKVAAVVSFYGPNDLVFQVNEMGKISPGLQALTGVTEWNEEGKKKFHELSPSSFIHKNLPPFLLIHGTEDEQVPYQQSVRFRRALLDKGGKVELFTIERGKHGMGSWEKLENPPDYKAKVIEWLRTALR